MTTTTIVVVERMLMPRTCILARVSRWVADAILLRMVTAHARIILYLLTLAWFFEFLRQWTQ